MPRHKLSYGPVKGFADGGPIELRKKPKMKPHVPAKVEDPIKGDNPGGSMTPGARGTYPMPKKKKAKGS